MVAEVKYIKNNMKTGYVIHDIDGHGYWSDEHKRFKGFIWAEWFDSKTELLEYAEKVNVGIFKIMKIYDTK